eukprot:SAG11_NODE_490_length_8982_cov_5.961162_4_plen_130_part_00
MRAAAARAVRRGGGEAPPPAPGRPIVIGVEAEAAQAQGAPSTSQRCTLRVGWRCSDDATDRPIECELSVRSSIRMYMCLCTCACVHVLVCMCLCLCLCTCACVHVLVCMCVLVCTHLCARSLSKQAARR